MSEVTPVRMDADLKGRWTAALRSGDFQQGQDRLLVVDESGARSYCCLGVLGVLLGLPEGEAQSYRDNTFARKSCLPLGGESAFLDSEVCGIPSDIQDQLAKINDGRLGVEAPKSFSEIADWIEENL